MPDGHNIPTARPSLLWVALGRQRVGKTALLNSAVQYFRGLGSSIEIWNADQKNPTHSLSTFFPDAAVPEAGGLADAQSWIERRLADQAIRCYHAVLDAGGAWTGFSSLVDNVPVIETLAAQGTKVIGLFCVGPEQADLDYLARFADTGSFLPEKTVVVINAGLVLSGRSAKSAFDAVSNSAVVRATLDRGGELIMMPALSCMAEVTDRGLTFADASVGLVKLGQTPMSLFDPTRVREWWTKRMPEFFGKFPADWLPIDHSSSTRAAETENVR